MKKLTNSQLKVYEYLKREMTRGIPPTVREICAATGLSSTSTVHAHLKSLEKMGLINRNVGKNRAISISGAQATAHVPILGTVTAGVPILAVEEIQGYLPFADKGNRELFALTIKGLSMKNIGILDGDYVIAEKTSSVRNGDVVVALVDNEEATVKTFYLEDGKVRLQPENEDFSPIYPEEVQILGKVIAQMRYYQ